MDYDLVAKMYVNELKNYLKVRELKMNLCKKKNQATKMN